MRMIDADALCDAMYHEAFETDGEMQKWDSGCWIRYKMFENAIDEAPTIEPKRGAWIEKIVDDVKITVCSNCDKEPTFTHYYDSCGNYSLSDFCPNCGARMK